MKDKKKKTEVIRTENTIVTLTIYERESLNMKLLKLEHFAAQEQRKIYKEVFHNKSKIEIQMSAIIKADDRIQKKIKELEINVPII
jgi:hypothetical protein